MSQTWTEQLQADLAYLAREGQLRSVDKVAAAPVVDLCSNDYLGVAREGYAQFLADYAGGEAGALLGSARASRLLGGAQAECLELEAQAQAVFAQAVLALNSGYHANIGLLPALTSKADLIVADKAVHASLIDGARLSAARLLRYPHQDLQALEQLLAKHRAQYRRVWVVTESVFSMDGSVTDLQALVALKRKFAVQLYVDEAHAVGLCGQGLGLAYAQGVAREVEVLVMPCAKALGSYGALVVCAPLLREFLVNHCRSLIFASALPPVVLAWTAYQLRRLPELEGRRARLLANTRALRAALGLAVPSGWVAPIVPLVIGENAPMLALAKRLREVGIVVGAVRYPTVARGAAQLRLCVNALLSDEAVQWVAREIIKGRADVGA